jgi:hypothetical protein
MYSDFLTLAVLALYLPLVLLFHLVWYRLAPELKDAPAQGPAIKVVGAGAGIVFGALALLLPFDAEYFSHLLFAIFGIVSLATFYFTFLCVSESGRRYYLLTLLARTPTPLSRDELASLYGKDYMIEVRLGRLLTWGVVSELDGNVTLKKYSFYLYSAFFYGWACLLGYRWFEKQR